MSAPDTAPSEPVELGDLARLQAEAAAVAAGVGGSRIDANEFPARSVRSDLEFPRSDGPACRRQ